MPTRLAFLLVPFLFLFLTGCREDPVRPPVTDPGPDSIDCPAPIDGVYGYRSPTYASIRQTVSHDGRFLAYMSSETALRVLDLNSMQDRRIDIEAMMPDSIRFIGVGNIVWCPYDNTRLAMSAVTLTDTVGDRKRFVYGQNLVTISLTENSIRFITPPGFPASGASTLTLFDWLSESHVTEDTFFLSYFEPFKHNGALLQVFYTPQTERTSPSTFPIISNGSNRFRQGKSGQYSGVAPYPGSSTRIYLNRKDMPIAATNVKSISWSPNEAYVAFSVVPKQRGPKGTFEQIWILDAEKILRERPDTPSVHVIDLQTRFCSYSFLGCHAEFITDSTLAVSMHPDGGNSPLWEISLDGRKIRQLTFLP